MSEVLEPPIDEELDLEALWQLEEDWGEKFNEDFIDWVENGQS